MLRLSFLFPTLLLAIAPARAADDAPLTAQDAVATSLANGAVVYREEHLLRGDAARPRERLVLFRCPGGAAFARKRIDYAESAIAPAFAFEDARTGYREGLRRKPAGDEVYFRERAEAAEQLALLPARAEVADAGFDEFVRAHWQALVAGESVPLRFAVPARLGSMDFRVRQAGTAQVDGEPARVFRMRLDGLLGFVAPHIDVAYSARSRRLLRFEGMSNVRDSDGRGQFEVRIDFPAPAQPAAPARWAAALSEPLVARCESGQAADSPAGRTPQAAR